MAAMSYPGWHEESAMKDMLYLSWSLGLCLVVGSTHAGPPPSADLAGLRGPPPAPKCTAHETLARLTLFEERVATGGHVTWHAEMVDARTGVPMEPVD
ncbi:hypothetical protein DBR42_17925, partial [Pelomonas sp. HMWF004]